MWSQIVESGESRPCSRRPRDSSKLKTYPEYKKNCCNCSNILEEILGSLISSLLLLFALSLCEVYIHFRSSSFYFRFPVIAPRKSLALPPLWTVEFQPVSFLIANLENPNINQDFKTSILQILNITQLRWWSPGLYTSASPQLRFSLATIGTICAIRVPIFLAIEEIDAIGNRDSWISAIHLHIYTYTLTCLLKPPMAMGSEHRPRSTWSVE